MFLFSVEELVVKGTCSRQVTQVPLYKSKTSDDDDEDDDCGSDDDDDDDDDDDKDDNDG
jgi:hypothetical protein